MSKIILDWNEYTSAARNAVAEGVVLLENDGALPLLAGEELAVFGRIQSQYYKSGTGSGGMVNVDHVYDIPEGLAECGIKLNPMLRETYAEWERSHPFNKGVGWGGEPWSQEEMPLTDELAAEAAKTSAAALCIIGRTAGEEQDSGDSEGSYRLTETELDMLKKVRAHFEKMTVLLNVGNVIDMSFVREIKPNAVAYVWQGGMTGGLGTADVLTGRAAPSGKLSDTIAASISDHPSAANFGDRERVFYCEDIYVGYRYFETFAKEKVLYPFGFGLSYTRFELTPNAKESGSGALIDVVVKNIGSRSGKETVQIYFQAPQGKLGQPLRRLCAFQKSKLLSPGETQTLSFEIPFDSLASFDDSGVTGNSSCFVLEGGKYKFFAGTDVRSAEEVLCVTLEEMVVQKLSDSLAPVLAFERIKPVLKNDKLVPSTEPVPLSSVCKCGGLPAREMGRHAYPVPEDLPYSGDKGIKLADVKSGAYSMDEFIAQLSDEDLSCIIRGEGMGSPRVTPGTASAFGGVTDNLKNFGIPAGCCDDGPSGMRLDCGTKAFSLPNGTMLACTFNTELVEHLYSFAGLEAAANNVECILGPGMNIHRHPLNGRNFEYYSEDPLLTGKMAAAQLRGLHKSGVTGTIKHFAANNQETGRRTVDSVVSKRALREIYLKGFEIAVKEGGAVSVMTTYGSLNGLWTAGNLELCTNVLREDWGFTGFVMTDWWASINEFGEPPRGNNFAAMIRAQNDVYMCCPDSSKNLTNDNTLSSLNAGTLSRGELQRSAANICRMLMNSRAMDRLTGTAGEIEIINRPYTDESFEADDITFYPTENGELAIGLSSVTAERGTAYVFSLDVDKPGMYSISLTAASELSETAQTPITLFTQGFPSVVFTFNGTGGEFKTITRDARLLSRYVTCRLYFGGSGLTLKDIKFTFTNAVKRA